MEEEWRELKGSRETYLISNLGNVKTKERIGARGYHVCSHEFSKSHNSSGYLRVSLTIDDKRKSYFIHRLVAKLFIPNPENKEYVNHKDGNKENNRADNLEWVTRSENEKHAWRIGLKSAETSGAKGERHGMHKLTQNQVDYIRSVYKRFDKMYGSKPLAERFDVSQQTITDIVNFRSWKHTREIGGIEDE